MNNDSTRSSTDLNSPEIGADHSEHDTLMSPSRRQVLGAVGAGAGLAMLPGQLGWAASTAAPNEARPASVGQARSLVSSFLGVNHAVSAGNPNFELADAARMDQMVELGAAWARPNVRWQWTQPTRDSELNFDKLRQVLAELKQRGLEAVPIIWNTPAWAADKSRRSFVLGSTRYSYEPNPDGTVTKVASNPETGEELSRGPVPFLTSLPPANVAEWTRFVEAAVKIATAEPYNVRYFQIWNEPTADTPFFEGSIQEFVDKVHIPAAKIIRQYGGKVVFGGWPPANTLGQFNQLLNHNEAWRWVDILDVHYFPPVVFQWLWEDWVRPGKIEGIWQTEVSGGVAHYVVPNEYPRMLYWALQHGLSLEEPNLYKLFYYRLPEIRFSGFPLSGGYDGHALLYTDENDAVVLSRNGEEVQTFQRILDGTTLEAYPDVEFEWPMVSPSRPFSPGGPTGRFFSLDPLADSVEAFRIDDRLVIAVHVAHSVAYLKPDESVRDIYHLQHPGPVAPPQTVDLLVHGLTPERIQQATRVSVRGQRSPSSIQIEDGPGGTRLHVDPRDISETVRAFERSRPPITNFYVELRLA